MLESCIIYFVVGTIFDTIFDTIFEISRVLEFKMFFLAMKIV